MITKKDIISQKLHRCYQTEIDYDPDDNYAYSSLIIELENGLLFDLCESFDIEKHAIKVEDDIIMKTLQKSIPCFQELWGEKIASLAISERFPTVIFLLHNNAIIYFTRLSPWSVGPLFEIYDFKDHDELVDFWDETLIIV